MLVCASIVSVRVWSMPGEHTRMCVCLHCLGYAYIHAHSLPFPLCLPPNTHAVEKESESLKREGSRGERGKGGGQEGSSASAAPGSHQNAPLQEPAVRPSSPPIAVAAQVLASGTGAAPAAQRPAAPNDGSGGNAGAKAAVASGVAANSATDGVRPLRPAHLENLTVCCCACLCE